MTDNIGPVFKRLPLGTELAVVVCHSSGENPAMSAIWKKKCCVSQKLKKKVFFCLLHMCTESRQGHVWAILRHAKVSVSLVGEIS